MMILVTYDVETISSEGRRRLRRVARVCMNYGQRVQNSVFECIVDNTEFTKLKLELSQIIDIKKDSIRFYLTGNNWTHKVETLGRNEAYNPEGDLII